jgi:hypothetical protein
MIIRIFIICFLLFTLCAQAQERKVKSFLDYTLNYRGLSRHDISIPIEFFSAAEKSPTNDAKLMLPLVKDMMANPLRSMTWMDSVSEFRNYEIKDLLINFCRYINFHQDHFIIIDGIIIPKPGQDDYEELISSIKLTKQNTKEVLKEIDVDKGDYLLKNLMSIFEETDSDKGTDSDIFKFNQARDSSIQTSKITMDILSKIDLNKTYINSMSDLYYCLDWYDRKIKSLNYFKNKFEEINNKFIQGDFYYYSDKNDIRIAIGGQDKNIYTGDFDFIIDLGGDDIYNIENDKKDFGGFRCIIDMSGNDFYTTSSDFALAGGLFSSSFIFDKEGDDIYESKGAGNLGAAIGGLGLLYDEKGNDTYKGISFSIGAGCFGVGLLVDREGNDFYIANSYSQGFGMTQGVGAIVDNKGNDSYLVDSRSLDIGRYNDHYVSMCQGYGLGLRPFYAGGIGLIIEGEGNDIYNTDIFGQGGAYWYGLGAITDRSGHDKYNGYQYSQGAGIHLAVGLLKDYDGWDFYQSNGVSQGCGHDFGYGMLWDVKGNDNYSAYSLSQGAGNADGIGILIDESGVDGYLNKHPQSTRGYGNQRREYGSIGVFLDVSGDDYYSQPGPDSTLINSSNWGVFNDFYLTDMPSQVSGDNFKVPVDSQLVVERPNNRTGTIIVNYSIADYFIMAKTIEPRFSQWQEYGFSKLIEDSLNSAKHILTKLGTSDHRETQVMRVLGQKIQTSVASALNERLTGYLNGNINMTQPEVSFACYIFGETRNPMGKDILLQLTYDENFRIRSSAINALGKIKYDENDTEFKNKTAERLRTLAGEYSEKKLYRKDIAFALGNYRQPENIPVLMKMLKDEYYGVRFIASDDLRMFGDIYMSYINGMSIYAVADDYSWMNPFLYSLLDLSDENFKIVYNMIRHELANTDGLLYENLQDIIRLRRGKSSEPGFIDWCNSELLELKNKVEQKVR